MYSGRIVEKAPVRELFARPQHPYTVGLLGSIPKLDREQSRLAAIEGQVPDPYLAPPGCRFAPRCPWRTDKCRAEPSLDAVAGAQLARCWYAPLEDFPGAAA